MLQNVTGKIIMINGGKIISTTEGKKMGRKQPEMNMPAANLKINRYLGISIIRVGDGEKRKTIGGWKALPFFNGAKIYKMAEVVGGMTPSTIPSSGTDQEDH
ncbi:hypothetical protein NPIL_260101 [Nephila pilipes]|uniref:Uncharacterized protein n=1 Tax=Nephila pilipes TaxID=299642 RepID=A0A8X6QB61_NEPPI|nr:hypothetical protein NPIL_260101 [Nephila pilipes]